MQDRGFRISEGHHMAPGIHGRGNDHRGQFPRSGVLDYLQQAFLGDRKRKAGHGPFHFPIEDVPPGRQARRRIGSRQYRFPQGDRLERGEQHIGGKTKGKQRVVIGKPA